MSIFKKEIIFSVLGGYVLGKMGNEIFGSETARKIYTKCATAGFILKDTVMEQVEVIQANATDIAAEAKENAEEYYRKRDKDYAGACDALRGKDFSEAEDAETEPVEEEAAEETEAE